MMTKNADKKREQMMMFSMDDMVPQNHMLRLIDKAINWNFIYDLVEEKYCPDNGRPSMDPVMLIKIPFIQYLYGIKSMRQTMKEIEVNVAYRWFLGLDMLDPVPHFSTFGKNYTRRFKDTDLFEQIFSKILEDCMKYKLVNTEQIFVDATHVKACANSKKMRKRVAHEQALWYEEELMKQQALAVPLKILVWVVEAVQERCSSMQVVSRQSMQKSVVDVIAVPKNVEVTQLHM